MNLNSTADINTIIAQVNQSGVNGIAPEYFYTKQLLDTIRIDGDQYVYHRYAEEMPIQEKADKLTVRRWAPLQAHTDPLPEGVPPLSDKGSFEKYEFEAESYGRYMEFTDKVDWKAVDPMVAHYTKEYSLVALETLDLLAREQLMTIANKRYAGAALDITEMTIANGKPTLSDLRLIPLAFKKALVKPRSNGRFHVIVSPEFVFDMIDDELIQKYMTIQNDTKGMFDTMKLIPIFDMEFYETLACPTSGEYVTAGGKKAIRAYKEYYSTEDDAAGLVPDANGYVYKEFNEDDSEYALVSGYVKDSRTGQDASYIPNQDVWTLPVDGDGNQWKELKIQHTIILGKDALVRTGLAGEQNAKMYAKPLGSAGVLDPIDQRQSIGFKINSVGYGSTRLEATYDYLNIPTQLNY